jgi:Salmonella virulence plasmid 65kDa B protein
MPPTDRDQEAIADTRFTPAAANERGAHSTILAATLLCTVVAVLLLPVGAVLRTTWASSPATTIQTPAPDPLSDSVAATAAEFRVDESGAATYSIPLYTVPGVAGVAPKLSLNYSSQAGNGPLGKGWSIGGLSSIARCRATREAGDFILEGTIVDGDPAPVNFTASDRYCLDGQRLLPAADGIACPAVAGMTVQSLRTEIQSFQRVCAYTPGGGATGVAFFTVERRDGSLAWYGDRDNNALPNRPDGYVNSTAPGKEGFALSWAQTRFQDSTGNYIDFTYHENPNGAVGEHLPATVRYTGRTPLPGQAAPAQAPFAQVVFDYEARATAERRRSYIAGGALMQGHRLSAVRSEAEGAQVRHYRLAYAPSPSGSGLDTMTRIQECRDDTAQAVCAAATTFEWSAERHAFDTVERPSDAIRGFQTRRYRRRRPSRHDLAAQYLQRRRLPDGVDPGRLFHHRC